MNLFIYLFIYLFILISYLFICFCISFFFSKNKKTLGKILEKVSTFSVSITC